MITIENTNNQQVLEVHTSFNIRDHMELRPKIEELKGVENLQSFGCNRYSFIVPFGKMFSKERIKSELEIKIKSYEKTIGKS